MIFYKIIAVLIVAALLAGYFKETIADYGTAFFTGMPFPVYL